MIKRFIESTTHLFPEAEAHCDGPCGIYDPASARVSGEDT